MMRQYRYQGPVSGATLKVGNETLEVLLNPRALASLPEDHPYTRRLVARGHLHLVEGGPAPEAAPEAEEQ